jgi:hypothetical protein
MKIQINKYDSEVYNFVKAYLKFFEEEWLYTPQHRLASSEFLKNLNDGVFDSIEYDVAFNPLVFNAEECFIVFRYYYIHNDMYKNYDKHANMSRIYSELGSQGDIFKSRKNIGKKGGKKSRGRYNLKKS